MYQAEFTLAVAAETSRFSYKIVLYGVSPY